MTFVLDACALLAFLLKEEGADSVEHILLNEDCIVHAFNLAEVYKELWFASTESDATEAINTLKELGVVGRGDMDETFWKSVVRCKQRVKPLLAPRKNFPWGDAFLWGLAIRMNGIVVTTDRADFEPVAAAKLASVQFIR